MNVPLLDLKPQYEALRAELEEAVSRVCRSQRFILGPEVEGFEEEFASYCGTKFALGVSSGTDALLISLMALGIGPGDEVITSPFTFFGTAGSIARTGALPVFADIDPQTFNIDPSQIEPRITERTKAIMPVHLFGQCAEMDAIRGLADSRGIPVIEDAAQAVGAEYRGRRAGSLGTAGCFSFFPSKNLGAFGDGGAVTTDDEALYQTLRALRMHGETSRYYHKLIGGNFRLDALQAAVLRVKLKHLDDWAAGRRRNAARYRELFSEAPLLEGVSAPLTLPLEASGCTHVYNQYVVRTPRRQELQASLVEQGVGCAVYYPLSLHQQQCFQYLGATAGDFPQSEDAAEQVLALPIFAELEDVQLEHAAEAVKICLSQS